MLPTIFFELMFPSPECAECHQLNDYWHLWTCKKGVEIRAEMETKIHNITRKYGGIEKYWITNQDNTIIHRPPKEDIHTRRICICGMPEYGTYLTCTKCNRKLHALCAGVTWNPNEITWTTFQCNTCNPKENYYSLDDPNKPVSRDTIITDVLRYSTRTEISRRRYYESKWSVKELQEHTEETEETQMKKRAVMGYIPKSVSNSIRERAREIGWPKNLVEKDLMEVNCTILETARILYTQQWKERIQERKEKGINVLAITKRRGQFPWTRGSRNHRDKG